MRYIGQARIAHVATEPPPLFEQQLDVLRCECGWVMAIPPGSVIEFDCPKCEEKINTTTLPYVLNRREELSGKPPSPPVWRDATVDPPRADWSVLIADGKGGFAIASIHKGSDLTNRWQFEAGECEANPNRITKFPYWQELPDSIQLGERFKPGNLMPLINKDATPWAKRAEDRLAAGLTEARRIVAEREDRRRRHGMTEFERTAIMAANSDARAIIAKLEGERGSSWLVGDIGDWQKDGWRFWAFHLPPYPGFSAISPIIGVAAWQDHPGHGVRDSFIQGEIPDADKFDSTGMSENEIDDRIWEIAGMIKERIDRDKNRIERNLNK